MNDHPFRGDVPAMTVHTIAPGLELRRIEALLDRMDPAPAHTCDVPGCVHLHSVHEDAGHPLAA